VKVSIAFERASHVNSGTKVLEEVLPLVRRHFRNSIVHGDTDLDRSDVFTAAIEAGAYFAIGGPLYPNRAALAQAIADRIGSPLFHAPIAQSQAVLLVTGARRTTAGRKPRPEGFAPCARQSSG
jgi:hypothetical protein